MRKIIFSFVLLACVSSFAKASVIGLDIESDGSKVTPKSGSFTLGWKFSLSESVVLTALGTWDQGADGLNESQQVGLWGKNEDNEAWNLLKDVVVDNSAISEASASNEGQWLFANVEETLLKAGEYVIGAHNNGNSGDAWQQGDTGISTDSRLTWIESRNFGPGSFEFPNKVSSGTQFFGPNLMFKSVSVPEPGTLGLFIASLTGLWLARKSKTRNG